MNSSKPLKSKQDGLRFVRKKDFEQNLGSQPHKTFHVIETMKNFNAGKNTEIEFFFYAATKRKPEQLADELRKLDYQVYVDKHRDRFCISGWIPKINIDNERISYGTKHMCQIGYKFDCEFDGWGMFVDSE